MALSTRYCSIYPQTIELGDPQASSSSTTAFGRAPPIEVPINSKSPLAPLLAGFKLFIGHQRISNLMKLLPVSSVLLNSPGTRRLLTEAEPEHRRDRQPKEANSRVRQAALDRRSFDHKPARSRARINATHRMDRKARRLVCDIGKLEFDRINRDRVAAREIALAVDDRPRRRLAPIRVSSNRPRNEFGLSGRHYVNKTISGWA